LGSSSIYTASRRQSKLLSKPPDRTLLCATALISRVDFPELVAVCSLPAYLPACLPASLPHSSSVPTKEKTFPEPRSVGLVRSVGAQNSHQSSKRNASCFSRSYLIDARPHILDRSTHFSRARNHELHRGLSIPNSSPSRLVALCSGCLTIGKNR
jgi:hypothetical protein